MDFLPQPRSLGLSGSPAPMPTFFCPPRTTSTSGPCHLPALWHVSYTPAPASSPPSRVAGPDSHVLNAHRRAPVPHMAPTPPTPWHWAGVEQGTPRAVRARALSSGPLHSQDVWMGLAFRRAPRHCICFDFIWPDSYHGSSETHNSSFHSYS